MSVLKNEDDQQHLERAREVLSAMARLLTCDAGSDRPADGDLRAGDDALAAARKALAEYLATSDELPDTRVAALMLDSVAVQAGIKDALLKRHTEGADGVRNALGALRNASSTTTLADRAAIEARRIGFRRALYSKIEEGTWLARSGFSVEDPEFGGSLVEISRAHPRRLCGPLLESEMVRRGTPMVVRDPQSNRRVHTEFIQSTGTTSYVAAPVLVWGEPVAMIHADRGVDGAVDEFDRCALGTYAEGLGLAIERAQLQERLQAVRRATAEYLAGVHSIADDFTVDVIDTAHIDLDQDAAGGQQPTVLIDKHGERLTPREQDVLRNLALGKTNAQIAAGLFVTEGTVKSHVKHILRKLGAANRTEAVARYHRLISTASAKVS